MLKGVRRNIYIALAVIAIGAVANNTAAEHTIASTLQSAAPKDTTKTPRFSVRKTQTETQTDDRKKSLDLKNPENIKDETEYDDKNNTYLFGTKLGDSYLGTPLLMTPEEYQQWSMRKSLNEYFRHKNEEAYKAEGKNKFDFTDMKFDLGPAEKIFGPGGVQIKTQGTAELKLGGNSKNTENPSLPLRSRKTFGFDFDEKINLNLNGKVGDKMNMNLNYNTDATFDFDTKKVKLKYEGKEDEIIKLLEAGNVSLPTNSSLVRGASSLFGIRTDLQFGKLKLQTVISQKKSSSKSVSSKNGSQTTDFTITADNYDENRHFFLAHYFRDTYDQNMATIPTVMTGINIKRIEVWVTNLTGNYNNPRNLIGFVDLGEHDHINHTLWHPGGTTMPSNEANDLYQNMTTNFVSARNIDHTTTELDENAHMIGGTDYERLENARLLSASEYTLNAYMGYISLKQTLQPDQVLAVAYEYTYRDKTYRVGEFASDIKNSGEALYVKVLKNTANIPSMRNWDLMMKNVYSLNAYSLQKEKFRLDIKYQSDTTGVYLTYLPEENLRNTTLLKLENLDRLDANNKANPNGQFDYVEGYTVNASTGRIYFPVVEPFGNWLRSKIGNDAVANRYCFDELYDSTKTIAKQIAEKNKFILTGQYKASSGSEIMLGATNIPQGSVVVTAGGVTLTENSDYTVDYSLGVVRIINQSILDAGTSVNVSLESDEQYGQQRKTLLGMNWEYDFSKSFQIGGTLQRLTEKALTNKVAMGSEPLNNTLIGFHFAYKKESQWLTDMLDKLPLLRLTKPSTINFTGEYAKLIAGKNSGTQGNASYLDDFESTKNGHDISNPQSWVICSTPSRFPEAKKSNNLEYGYNRALLAWYNIDPLFTRRNSSLTPSHIKNDPNQLSSHYIREVYERELYPNRETTYGESSTLHVLNLAYYPNERGPYNLDPDVNRKGLLNTPEKRWGGMMRKLDITDFETSNIEYIEFWMLDPFIYSPESRGGDFYINLGNVSEDILKDGKKSFESGLPTDDNSQEYTETVWGRVPTTTSIVYAFNTSSSSRNKQDVGYNGLSSTAEQLFSSYADYINAISAKVDPQVLDSIKQDPAGDDYHYFRGSDFDTRMVGVLDRYKHINSPEGNSPESSGSSYDTSYKSTPDVEDINQDYTLNEYEKYFEYAISIRPQDMIVGRNHIVDKRETRVKLRNGNTEKADWYQFRIPVNTPNDIIGNISDFSSIRFIRMYLTGFSEPVILRFGSLDLVRGEWRTYEQALNNANNMPSKSGAFNVSAVNYEENSNKTPVNYVIPPGISRVIDPSQPQLKQDNEQALSLTVHNLASGDARAVYKNTSLDLRRYKHIQMYTHANALDLLDPDYTQLENNQVSVFVRLGSDYKNNYYEYEIPLTLTPADVYTDGRSKEVWPSANMLDVDLSVFSDVKKNRNKAKAEGLSSFTQIFSQYDPKKNQNKVSVMGNPSLGEVKTIMIGVRNNSRSTQSAEVWVNELRLQDYNNEGGWAAQGNLNMQISDLGSVNLTGHIETAGFGGIEQGVNERRNDNEYQYSITTNVELGKLFPEKAKVSAPLYYSYTKDLVSPKYNPFDNDQLLDDALDACANNSERDSLKSLTQTTTTYSNLSLSNAKVNIRSRKPMPYDPANFAFSYSHSRRYNTGETTKWETDENWKGSMNYSYTPSYKPLTPFGKLNNKNKWLRILREFNFNWLPQNVTFNTDIIRKYYELQERDLDDLSNKLPLSFSKEFLWNREFSIRWDFTKQLHATFTSATHAEIEEPAYAVNKDLYPDEYKVWKDSVKQSLRNLGRPLDYRQTFNLSYELPINKIPIFDWVTCDATYNASYNWNRGAEMANHTTLGNTIANQSTLNFNGKFNLETLYNKVPFLSATNKRFAKNVSNANNSLGKKKAGKQNGNKPVPETKQKGFTKEIKLRPDTTTTITHNQRSKRITVTATTKDGHSYAVRYKIKDQNKIELRNLDTTSIKVSIVAKPSLEDNKWYSAAQYVARTAMMVRNVSFTYRKMRSMSLPGFIPEIGDFFGQRNGGILAPGLDFAFGLNGDDYINKARDNGWLMAGDSITTPASTNANEDIQIRLSLEPIRNMKIDLNASRTDNRSKSITLGGAGMNETHSGSFNMTTITIGTALSSTGNADNGYSSKTFRKFLSNLDIVQQRIEHIYNGLKYPEGTSLAGQTFNPENGTISKYSADVMIPAFLATYTNKNATRSSLDIFPSMLSMLPNWKVTYNGLVKLPWLRNHFKSINLTHAYKSIYAVGSYNSLSNYMSCIGYDRGFTNDVVSGAPVPSSIYDISSVSINESFSPLLGLDMTLNNNMTIKLERRKSRVMNLSVTALQIVETTSDDYVVGLGYTLQNLNLFGAMSSHKIKGKGNKGKNEKENSISRRNTTSHDLNIRVDISFKNQSALCRNIQTELTQATSGNKAIKMSASADYTFSKRLTLNAYFDRQRNVPLLSSSAYPTTTVDFGVSMKFSLTR